MAGVGAGEEQQVINHPAHMPALVEHVPQGGAVLLGATRVAQGDLSAGSDGGDRDTQLVRSPCSEPTAALAGFLQPARHGIEGVGQPVQLIVVLPTPPGAVPHLVADPAVQVTGIDVLSSGGGGGPSVLVEALVGGVGALLVLAFVFGSLLALVPLLMAIVAILTTFLLVWGLTAVTDVSFIVEFLIALIGLGIAIDYSLLIVMR